MKTIKIKLSNYGNIISFVTGKPLICQYYFGSYTGDYMVVLDAGDNIEIWKGGYGSCSGCDWLEAVKNYQRDEVSEEEAREYLREKEPFAIISKINMLDKTAESFEPLLPANTRAEIYDFEPTEMFNEIIKYIKGNN